MRFKEFNIILEAAPSGTFYTIGDSHAKAIGDMGVIGANNLAVGGTVSTDAKQLASINRIPAGSTVVISAGHNDAASAARASAEAAKKNPPIAPARIASNVAAMVNAAQDRGLNVIYVLFPNGTYDKDSYQKYYKGQYILQVREAIKSMIDVPIIDLEGSPLPDGVHAAPGKYKEVATQVKARMQQPKATPVSTDPATVAPSNAVLDATPPQPTKTVNSAQPSTLDKIKDMVSGMMPAAFKNKTTFTVPVPQGRTGAAVRDVQQVLEKLGYSVGPPGLDGIRGPYTTAAVKKFQEDNPPLEVDGDPGPETVAVMNKILKERPKIAAALKSSTTGQVKASTPTAGAAEGPLPPLSVDSVTTGKVGKLLDFVAGPESSGYYDMMNGGQRKPEILKMTIKQAYDFQIAYAKAARVTNPKASSAMGRYQIMHFNTLEYAKKLGLDPNTELFSPENQDKYAIQFMKEKGLDAWLNGKIDDNKFLNGLAKVWAGLPLTTGLSNYHGDSADNKAGISTTVALNSLNDIKSD